MTRYDIPWAITPTDSELTVLNELMAKYELHTLGTFDLNVWKANSLLLRGKLAKAESQYFSHIESLKSARERLKSEGKDRIVKLIHGLPQDTEHQEPPDPDTVLTLAMQVFEANISAAEEWHLEARLKREKFGDKIPDEERYQEVKGRKRTIKVQFVIIALVLSILAVAVGAWLYFIFAWLIVIPIALWAFAMFLALLRYGFQDESILSFLDSELRELAYRDGWLKRPKGSNVAKSLHELAEINRAEGNYDEAEPLYKKSLATGEDALGPDHPDLATTLEDYAGLLRATGRDAEAEPLEARARAIRTTPPKPQTV